MAFAEDLVKNEARADECTVLLKKLIKENDIPKELLCSELGLKVCSAPDNCGEDEKNDGK